MKTLFSLSGIRLGTPHIIDFKIHVPARSIQKSAKCPCCAKKSKYIHSSYVRVLRDLPMSTHCVSINLTARKFFCKNPDCKRRIFTEQPGDEIKAYSRMTNRTRQRLQNIFLEVSARKGAYIAGLISLPVSPSTALRFVDSLPIPLIDKVKVLGIDDWAYRKGLSYGTLLVNIETRQAIDLLEGRDGVALKRWLKQHPEVETVTRDRASSYSSAVSAILPNAEQVADRFHLLTNLSDSVYEVIRHEYRDLSNSLLEDSPPQVAIAPDISDEEPTKGPGKEKGEMNDYFKARFDKVKEMLKDGVSVKSIAKSLLISRNTVRRYSKMDILLNKGIHVRNNYNEYQEIIEREFSEGKNITTIFDSITKAGFKGGRTSFYEQFKDHPMRTNPEIKTLPVVKQRLMSPRKIARYLRFADLSKIENNFEREIMISLFRKNTILEKLQLQILSFKDLLLGNDDSLLEDWMNKTWAIGKFQLQTFVRGLRSDIKAVRNAIKTNWSNGQVEGQVNRLKSIKRQMYGRASFELLRRKVILSKAG